MRRSQGLIGRLAVGASLVCLLLGLTATAEANSVVRRTSTGELQTLDPQTWTYGQDGTSRRICSRD